MRRHHVENLRGFIALAEGRLDEAERELVASGRGRRASRHVPIWPTAAGPTPPAWRRSPVTTSGRSRTPSAAPRSSPGCRSSSSRSPACGPARSPGSAATPRPRTAADRQAQLAERLASPRLKATTDHDTGLLAMLAGDYERAQELLGAGARRRPDRPARRRAAAARRGARPARPRRRGRPGDPRRHARARPSRRSPGGARRADGVRPGPQRPRPRRSRARRAAPARVRAPLAPARRATRAASSSPRSSTSGARRSRASRTRPTSSQRIAAELEAHAHVR